MKYQISEGSFLELRNAAMGPWNLDNANQVIDAVIALGEWCDSYGSQLWNGESYDVSIPDREPSGSHNLKPIYKWDEENDQGEVIGYELDGWEYYKETPNLWANID